MSKEKDVYQVSLKAIIKNKNGEILALKALEEKTAFAGFYDLPGGRIDVDEFSTDFLNTLLREIKEEVGDLQIMVNPKPVGLGRHLSQVVDDKGNPFRILYIFFEVMYENGEVVISDEHLGYKWINPQKIKLEDYFVSGILEGLKIYLKK